MAGGAAATTPEGAATNMAHDAIAVASTRGGVESRGPDLVRPSIVSPAGAAIGFADENFGGEGDDPGAHHVYGTPVAPLQLLATRDDPGAEPTALNAGP